MNISRFIWLIFFFSISCSPGHQKGPRKWIFRYNESKGISTLDPALAREQRLIWPVNQLFNGLVQMNDSLEVIPCIAKSWNLSEDRKTYTFFLRDDVFFHDSEVFPAGKGRKVSAYDFEYSFRRITDPEMVSPGKWVFDRLDKNEDHPEGFKAVNDSTFKIWLKMAFPPFPGMLTMPYCHVVPEEAVRAYGEDFGRNPVGTGPFRFKLWREDEKLILLKNPVYFETDGSGNRLPYLDAVSVTFIKDKQSEFLEFMKGNLDFLNGVHPVYKDILLTGSGQLNPGYQERFRLITQPYLNTEYLGFLVDTSLEMVRKSPIANINIRKAINYGFDRAKMIKYLRNNIGLPAVSGIIPRGLPAYNPDKIKGYHYDPDTAAFFLEEAGFPGGKGLPDILLTTTSDYLDICEYIQFELSRIGINLKIDVATGASFRNRVANSNLLFFRGSWIADYPDAESYMSLFYSPNKSPFGPNYTHYSNSTYDSLYLSALASADPGKTDMLYNTMDGMILDDSVIVPLFYDCAVRFTSVYLEGLGSNPMNLLTLKTVKFRN